MASEMTDPDPGDDLDIILLLNTLTAFKKGDFTPRMPVSKVGIVGKVYDTLNDIMDHKLTLFNEIKKLNHAIGDEGRLTHRIQPAAFSGAWSESISHINALIDHLVQPINDVGRVIGAVAHGDLSQVMSLKQDGQSLKGELLYTANIVNGMVDQLASFGSEVTRVAREVGTEGKLGGQATVKDVSGIWKELTDNVNSMARNLTAQVRDIVQVTTAVAKGDLTKQVAVNVNGEMLELKNTINTMVDQLSSFASEVTRMAWEVGTEGKLGGQASVKGVAGTWKDLTDNVNSMARNLTAQVRDIAQVTTAVAKGDLTKKIAVDVSGEMLELKNTINTMVDQLSSFASEVTRVAWEVGTEGMLGGQAQVKGVAGTWKDLTDSVNSMANNLTSQVRNIAEVTAAVATGELSKKITVDVRGGMLELKDTINTMVDQLSSFASEVTRVAWEAGTEGKLGGQARVPGAAGLWRNLTDNVNQLAGNLTTQVRSIAEIATAVSTGDLSRSIKVEAKGEVALLKDNLNAMICTLRETTRVNTEQDWLKTNLAKFARLLQGQRDLTNVSRLVLSELTPMVNAQYSVFYFSDSSSTHPILRLVASYAETGENPPPSVLEYGQGLIGQSAQEKQRILVTEVPQAYLKIGSGLGSSLPANIVILPVLFEGQVRAVIEIASFHTFTETHLSFLDQLMESIGIVLNTIAASMRTEELLKQSQTMTEELLGQQVKLTITNQCLEEQTKLLSLTSRYKSEFLANMSHEIRTPLNSILILSKVVSENSEGKLSEKQVEYMKTIYSSGTDLLGLINDILDLSKVESGTMSLELSEVAIEEIHHNIERTFREVAVNKGLGFKIEIAPGLPKFVQTDIKRIQQILNNLLSNAFKFTDAGNVILRMGLAEGGWDPQDSKLSRAELVIAFSVTDEGIGIPPEKHAIIFEVFQQADGSTSRRYGGTGLGLPISREVAQILGGEIKLQSEVGRGSCFTLYLPTRYIPAAESGTVQTEVEPMSRREDAGHLELFCKTNPVTVQEPMIDDDRLKVKESRNLVLIIASDSDAATLLLATVRASGWQGIVAQSGDNGLELAKQFRPAVIAIDSGLGDSNAWMVVDRLKHQPLTRHVPVIVIAPKENPKGCAQPLGLWGTVEKPLKAAAFKLQLDEIDRFLDKPTKTCLLVIEASRQRDEIAKLLQKAGLEVLKGESSAKILEAIDAGLVDCLVVDTDVAVPSLDQLFAHIAAVAGDKRMPAIVIHSEYGLSFQSDVELKAKAGVRAYFSAASVESVFRWVTQEMHLDITAWDESLIKILENEFLHSAVFTAKTVHIVDDDIRNIFAITALLEKHQIKVSFSEDGQSAIEYLKKHNEMDIVLMDIMMPGKDGYETIAELRGMEQLHGLVIIALTAKAMLGDREKCLAAGASDYITKPVEADKLISLIRIWLQK